MRALVIPFALIGVILAIGAAAVAGGAVTGSGDGWLFPGALAALGLSWLLSLLPWQPGPVSLLTAR